MSKKRNRNKHRVQNSKVVRVNWVLALLISIFFGWLGVDRFVMRKIGTGILKLITFGGLTIWWLIDIILIASKYQFKNVQWVE